MKCKKDENSSGALPEITSDGRNTFGCYIDGEIFLPRTSGTTPSVKAARKGNTFYIDIVDLQHLSRHFSLEIKKDISNGEVSCASFYQKNCQYSNCTTVNTNLINLKINEDKKIISAQFDLTFSADANCPEIKATEGRFDLKYIDN